MSRPAITRLGIFGGTFDPIHLGHLTSAGEVARAFNLTRVLLVLSARPPHKKGEAVASVEQRLEMLAIATAGDPLFEVSDLEATREGPSYTVDTLVQLHHLHPDSRLNLIVGIDAYLDIDSWRRPGELLEHANIIVTTRPGTGGREYDVKPPFAARETTCYDPEIGCYVHNSGHTLRSYDITGLDVSASDIRRRVGVGLPIEHLTGKAVASYILAHRVYGARRC